MKRSTMTALGVAAAVALLAGNASAAQDGTEDCEDAQGNKLGTISWSPLSAWPPNHKDVETAFVYTDNSATQAVQLTVVPKLHDEVLTDNEGNQYEEQGSGNTPFVTDSTVDGAGSGTGSATVTGQVRAERSGRGDGRTYSFDYTAQRGSFAPDGTFVPAGQSCGTSSTDNADDLTIVVPHDQRAHNGK